MTENITMTESSSHIVFQYYSPDTKEVCRMKIPVNEIIKNNSILENIPSMTALINTDKTIYYRNHSWLNQIKINKSAESDFLFPCLNESKISDSFCGIEMLIQNLIQGVIPSFSYVYKCEMNIVPGWYEAFGMLVSGTETYVLITHNFLGKQEFENGSKNEKTTEQVKITNHSHYILSHDLRNHLSNISGLAQLISQEHGVSSNLTFLSDNIINQVKFISDIVDSVTRSEKDEHIYLSTEEQNEKLEDIILKVLISSSSDIKKTNTHVSYSVERVSDYSGNKLFLYSILYNLVTNSIKYKSAQRDLKIDISGEYFGDRLKIVYSDTAMGFDMQKVGHLVFGLNQRFSGNDIPGTGRGLYMIRHQVEMMNGVIELESRLNAGSIFTITLPRN